MLQDTEKDVIASAVRAATAATQGGQGGGKAPGQRGACKCLSGTCLLHNKRFTFCRLCCLNLEHWLCCMQLAHSYQPDIRDCYSEILNTRRLACWATQKSSAGHKWPAGRRLGTAGIDHLQMTSTANQHSSSEDI